MRIFINNRDYENASWNVSGGTGNMDYHSNESLVTILSELDGADRIEVYDDNEVLTGVWYIAGIAGISKNQKPDETWTVSISFNVSILDNPAEEQIQDDLIDSVDAIMELAGLIDEISEAVDAQAESIDGIATELGEAKGNIDEINESIADLGEIREGVDELREQVNGISPNVENHGESIETLQGDMTAVKMDIEAQKDATKDLSIMRTNITNLQEGLTEANQKLDGIPHDIPNRFSELWDQYNALADRVARLENKEG